MSPMFDPNWQRNPNDFARCQTCRTVRHWTDLRAATPIDRPNTPGVWAVCAVPDEKCRHWQEIGTVEGLRRSGKVTP